MGDDRSKPPPLERRVPGATRAGPASPSRPELPEALLQRMQAVVKAAHAQALQEEEARRGRGTQPDQDAPPEAPGSLPRRVPGTAGAPKEPNGVPWRKLPAAAQGRLSDQDAEFDTDPFLPRLTASGTIASSPANSTSAQPNHAAQQNHTAQQSHSSQQNQEAQPNHSTRKHIKQQDETVKPGHALKQDRALRRRDRRATKRERTAQAERERVEQDQVAQAERAEQERAEQERAAQAERTERERAEQERAAQAERAEQERAERERAQAERAEQESAAQAERERAAQAERERAERERAAETEQATRAERELAAEAAWAEREHAAQAEHERAAQTEGERPGQAAAAEGTAGTEPDVAERAGPAQPTAAPVQAEPGRAATPASTTEPASIPGPDSPAAPDNTAKPDGNVPPADRRAAAVRTPAKQPERPSLGVRRAPRRRRYRTAALAVGVAVALAAGPLALMLSRSSPAKLSAADVTRDQAANWVAQQVSSSAVVSCDVTMCQALRADGVPVGDLLVMGQKTRDLLLSSQVIVSTAALRNQFGSSLTKVYAPTVLASFGSGKTQINVRVIAHDGAAAYLADLKADWQERRSAGGALAGFPRITLSAQARRQMDTGQVDARLLFIITELASQHPADILAFGDLASGASPEVPLRSVTLAVNGSANLRSMLDILRSQRGDFRAAHIETTQRDGQSVMVVEFAAPMPLGLINGPSA
jgi:hypothetical protein